MENLGIDPKLLIAQLVNFVLFFFIFKKFMAKPFQKFLKDEEKKDTEKERLMGLAKNKEEEMIQREEQLKKRMKKEQTLLLEEAKKEAGMLKKDMVESARSEIETLKESARKQMKFEQERMKKEMQLKIIELSSMTVNALLKNTLTEDKRKEITDKIVSHLAN